MKATFKRILSMLLCLCMLLSLAPVGSATVTVEASVTIGGVTTQYSTLDEAIAALSGATAEDEAVLTILKDLDLGNSYPYIYGGVFTLDLNGCTINGEDYALYLYSAETNVTITDSGEGGTIRGKANAVGIYYATLQIEGGTLEGTTAFGVAGPGSITIRGGMIQGACDGINTGDGTVDISGGTISGDRSGLHSGAFVSISGGTILCSATGIWDNANAVNAYDCSVEITGGVIHGSGMDSSGNYVSGLYANCSVVTISGGSIYGEGVDINTESGLTLTVGENDEGATFPGGITVEGTTLDALLGEGTAYWQGDKMVAAVGTEITGGDVVIKASCTHENGSVTYTYTDEAHSYTYSCCGYEVTQEHSFDPETLQCICGAKPAAVASVTIGGVTTQYSTLDEAIAALSGATAEDEAVLTILKDIDLGAGCQYIDSGVFTIDLNGCEISSTSSDYGALRIIDTGVDVTVTDSGTTGKITGGYAGIELYDGAVTLSGGTISAKFGIKANDGIITVRGGTISAQYGINTNGGTITVNGGTIDCSDIAVFATSSSVDIIQGAISGSTYGVYASSNTTVTLSGGTISGRRGIEAEDDTVAVLITGGTISTSSYAVSAHGSTVTISGGSIHSEYYDLSLQDCNAALLAGENGTGATFPGGIEVLHTNLNAIIGVGVAYWQGDKMIIPADDSITITGGDVVIKAACTHENGSATYTYTDEAHSYTYSCCGYEVTQEHSFDTETLQCICGAKIDAVASVTIGGVSKLYATLNEAVLALESATAEDEAVLTILKDIDLGDGYQRIYSGVFTIDLNGCTINGGSKAFSLAGSEINITITDSGEGGTIRGETFAVETYLATLQIEGGTLEGTTDSGVVGLGSITIRGGMIQGACDGINTNNATVDISGGTISGGRAGVLASGCDVSVSGGTILCSATGINYGANAVQAESCSVEITGGVIHGSGMDSYDNYARGLYANRSDVTISGGSIYGEGADIMSYGVLTLTVGENGEGATFPGGITVEGTTLDALLGEGAAYWQGDKPVAAVGTEITGGDVVIKAACTHENGSVTYTYTDETHSCTYSCCGAEVTEEHSFDAETLQCICGAKSNAVAYVTIGGAGKPYNTLGEAIAALSSTTAEDEAVLTVLKDIDLGAGCQYIDSGVFTIDLNGCAINGGDFALYLYGAEVNITITDLSEGGTIRGETAAVAIYYATLQIEGGTFEGTAGYGVYNLGVLTVRDGMIRGTYDAINASGATVEISGGTISGDSAGLYAIECDISIVGGTILCAATGVHYSASAMFVSACSVEITGGMIHGSGMDSYGNYAEGLYIYDSTVTISGGSIYGEGVDIYTESGLTLTVGENDEGATFPGSITVEGTTLDALLGEGAAYWQGDKMLTAVGTEITGGDVVIKAACAHENGTVTTTPKDGQSHYCTYSCCGAMFTEPHTLNEDGVCSDCGFDSSKTITINMTDSCDDGWSGNAIEIYENGVLVGTATIEEELNNGAFQLSRNPEKVYTFVWITGTYDYECSFEIVVRGETVFSCEDATALRNGKTFFILCDHSYDEGVETEATCTKPGGIYYTCVKCGETYTENEIPATGHSFGEDGNCTICGFCPFTITFNMSDDYGDSWNGNAIAIYCGDELIAEVALDDGITGTVSVELNLHEEYTVCWLTGSYAEECSFEVLLGGESVFSKEDCTEYAEGDGYIFSIINGEIVFEESGETPDGGWTEIDGNWYYIDPETGAPITGIKRVPYPTMAINGITYAPDQEAMDYCQANGTEFIDAEKGWFRFNSEGVFCASFTGQYDYYYFENGFMTWHPGLTEYNGRYYYFIGDMQYGGNKTASGNVYVSKNQTDLDITIGGVYTFNTYGRLCEYDGITDIDGTLYYYEDYQLMIGAGLVEIDGDYYYVRSNGALVVGQSYWVANSNGLDIPAGEYEFDSNGKLILPPPALDGIVEVDGVLYYYIDGAVAYGAGVIEIDGNYYYVRSNGQLVRGQAYYITTVGDTGVIPGRYRFNDEGVMQNPRFESQGAPDGIVDGYYYVDGKIAYGAGLLYLENEGCYIYVRSNGQLATRRYWVTANNDLLPCGLYDFGFDGKLFIKSGTSSRR